MTDLGPVGAPPAAHAAPPGAGPAQQQEWYAVFCGDINLANVGKLTAGLTFAMANNVRRLHLLFHTWGGFAGDGVYLYNFLKQLPLDVVLYNAGQVASAGSIAFLGARSRKTTSSGMFMIHRAHNSPQAANAARLTATAESLKLDDERTEAILREHLELPKKIWTAFKHHDVYIKGVDAVAYGIADEIADFAPPVGTKVMNALG